MKTRKELISGYNELAFNFAERFCKELDEKPFDKSILQRFADSVPIGRVCDLGCGPGHVAAHLDALGLDSIGIDLSPKMIEEAKRRFPHVQYQIGDMVDLDMPAESLGGIVALYAVIHLSGQTLESAFREMHRVLVSEGRLLVSFHRGRGVLQQEGVLNTHVSFECNLFEPGEVVGALERAGLSVLEVTIRKHYKNEHPTNRVYILATKEES